MRRPFRPLALLCLLAATPAAGQSLPYRNLLMADQRAAPRLPYAFVLDEPAAQAPTPDAGREAVRGFYGDRFEWRPQRGRDAFSWDVSAELGGPDHRLWLATTGDGLIGGPVEFLEVQALYSRPLADSGLSLQAGVRRDFVPRPRRSYAVIGVQGGLGDAWLGGQAFLSHRGELTGRLFAYYDLPLGARLLLQPAVETEIAAADVAELGIGAGPIYLEAGLRLRYRVAEAFSPYLGVNWERLLGRTARFARQAGDDVEQTSFVLGVRSYF